MPRLRRCQIALLGCLLPAIMAFAEPIMTPLSPLDLAYLEQQKQYIDELAARRLGRRLSGDQTDLELLQAILDRQLVKVGDEAGLQALGIVLGNTLASEYALEWIIYSDSLGRSRALYVGGDRQCLFPATMIARRARAGLAVDVHSLYDKAAQTIEKLRAGGLRTY